MLIKFTNPQEFIDELDKDRYHIERRIVRLTALYTPSKSVPTIYVVKVIATAKLQWGDIIRLEHFLGDYWSSFPEDDKINKGVLQRRDDVYRQIEEACKRFDLEIRAGTYEEGREA